MYNPNPGLQPKREEQTHIDNIKLQSRQSSTFTNRRGPEKGR